MKAYASHMHQYSKILVSFFAVLTVALLFGGIDAYAFSATEGDFSINYRKSGDTYNNVTVEKYTGNNPDVVLPATVTVDDTQVPITTINSSVFKGNEAITSVVIPEGYTDLPYDAFNGCVALQSVSIPGTMTMIGSNAFQKCAALETVTFAPGTADLTLGNGSFAECTSLQSITLPKQLSNLNNGNVFYGCTSLEAFTVDPQNEVLFADNGMVFQHKEDGTVALQAYPFGSQATKLEIPEQVQGLNVSELGPHLFRNNAVLTEVTIPATVSTVERFAFNGCSALMTVNVLNETAPTLNSSCFVGMAQGSVINVLNETVAAAFEPADEWTTYYDSAATTVQTASAPAPAAVEAALTLKAAGLSKSGEAAFDLYLDSASYVNTLLVKLSFDPTQLTWDKVTLAGEVFSNVTPETVSDGTVNLMFNKMDNVLGYTHDEQVKIATITLQKASDATGRLPLTIAKAEVSGITDTEEPAISGTVTLTAAEDSVFAADYNVNGDGVVDQVDITEAQRYYQVTSESDNWESARAADVNGDNVVDLEDLIAIFRNLTDF